MSIKPSDVLFYGAGASLKKYGTLSRHTTVIARRGEDVEETFTRTGVGAVVGGGGVIVSAAANLPRVNHYADGAILSTPRLLLEDARTSLITDSETLGGGGWTTANASVGSDADTAPDGAATADRIIEDATAGVSHGVFDSVTKTASTDCTFSVFAKAASRTWLKLRVSVSSHYVNAWFDLSNGVVGGNAEGDDGSFTSSSIEEFGADWYRCSLTCGLAAQTAMVASIVSADADESDSHNGDGSSYIIAWGAQFEDQADFGSSYIPTSGGAGTRNTEAISFPFWSPPQETTVYTRLIERGSASLGAAANVVTLGDSSDTERFQIYSAASGGYRIFALNTTGTVLAASPSVGDSVELMAYMADNTAGTMTIYQSIAEAAATSQSDAFGALPSVWNASELWLNSVDASNVGFNEFEAVIVARGSHSLADFRAILP